MLVDLHFYFGCDIYFLETGRKSGFFYFARVGVSRFDNALHPIMGQAILPVFYLT
jgi:hypothetical protein